MNKFLIIYASNDIYSKNLEIANFLEKNLNSFYWSANLIEIIPFINKELLNKNYFPPSLIALSKKIKEHKQLIFVLSSHNGNFTSFFKNIFDWLSIEDRYFLKNKRVIVVSASNALKKDLSFEVVSNITFRSVECDWFKFINCIDFDNNKKAILKKLLNYINNMHA